MVALGKGKPSYTHTLRLFEDEEDILKELMEWTGKGIKPTIMIILGEKVNALHSEEARRREAEDKRPHFEKLKDFFGLH